MEPKSARYRFHGFLIMTKVCFFFFGTWVAGDAESWDLVLNKTWNSWENIRETRNVRLEETDAKTLLPEGADKVAWETYRQALRDLPETYVGAEAHTVPHPDSPEELANIARRKSGGEE